MKTKDWIIFVLKKERKKILYVWDTFQLGLMNKWYQWWLSSNEVSKIWTTLNDHFTLVYFFCLSNQSIICERDTYTVPHVTLHTSVIGDHCWTLCVAASSNPVLPNTYHGKRNPRKHVVYMPSQWFPLCLISHTVWQTLLKAVPLCRQTYQADPFLLFLCCSPCNSSIHQKGTLFPFGKKCRYCKCTYSYTMIWCQCGPKFMQIAIEKQQQNFCHWPDIDFS